MGELRRDPTISCNLLAGDPSKYWKEDSHMTNTKRWISGAVLSLGLGVLIPATPALADRWDRNDRRAYREYRDDVRDLRQAQREYRRDRYNGASREELRRDRQAIQRERRELAQHRRDWNDRNGGRDRWRGHDHYDDHYRDYYRRGWRDRDWYGGWWR
jgi:hypothetical protein